MKTFCFDFDGTLVDTLPLIVKTADDLLKKSGEKELSGKILREIREEGIEEVVQKKGIPLYKLFFLYLKIKKAMNGEIKNVSLEEGMRDVLIKIKRSGNIIGILTSNSKENVNDFLEENGLNFFDFISSSGIWRKEKVIKKLKKKGGIFVYIGDETRDIRAGRRAKVKTVAVPWGLSSKKALLRERPDVLVEVPGDLLNLPF